MPGSRQVESWLHALFAEDRDNGEWFRSTSRLLEFIALLPLTPIVGIRREKPIRALTAEFALESAEPEPKLEPEVKPASLETTDEENNPAAMLTVQEFAAMGGKARARKLTSTQRKASAKKAAAARWGKKAK
jgi:hypothetical protein